MRRFVGTLALLCAFSILILAIPVGATSYDPNYYIYGLYASGESYTGTLDGVEVSGASGRSTTGTFTIPLNLDSRFKWVYLGANYNSITYDVGAEYKFVISVTTGATGNYNKETAPLFYTAQRKTGLNPLIDMNTKKLLSQNGTFSKGASDTYTFTYDNIPYDSVVGNSFYCIQLVLADFDSAMETELYIVNSYFGLESYYDEDKYNSQILENLGNIQNSIDEGNEKLDGIQDSLDNQIDNEIDRAESEGNNTNAEAEQAVESLPDFSESYNNILNNLTTVLYDMNTQSYIDLPNGEVEVMGYKLNIWGGATSVDFSEILANEDVQTLISIGKGVSVLGCMATSIYWAFRIKEWITANDEVITPEIPFLPGGW